MTRKSYLRFVKEYLKRISEPLNLYSVNLMITAQTIRKTSFFIAVASFTFTLIAALVKYLQLDLTTIGAPASYYIYTVLAEVLPYLFVGVIALLFSVLIHDEEPAHTLSPLETKAATIDYSKS